MNAAQRFLGILACTVAFTACTQPSGLTPEQGKLRDQLREQAHKPLDMSQPYVPEGKMVDYRTWYPSTTPQPPPAPRADGKCPYYTPTDAMEGTPDCAYAKKAMEGLWDKN